MLFSSAYLSFKFDSVRALYMPDEQNLCREAGEKRNQSRRLTSSFFMSSSMSR